jgi:hypothetical protein
MIWDEWSAFLDEMRIDRCRRSCKGAFPEATSLVTKLRAFFAPDDRRSFPTIYFNGHKSLSPQTPDCRLLCDSARPNVYG